MATRVRRRRPPSAKIFTSGPWNNVQTLCGLPRRALRLALRMIPLSVLGQLLVAISFEPPFRGGSTAENAHARQTFATVMWRNVNVVARQQMSVLAMRLYAMLERDVRRVKVAVVDELVGWLQVVGIATRSVLALVMDVRAIIERTSQEYPHHTMHLPVFAPRADNPVSLRPFVGREVPAAVPVVCDTREYSFLKGLAGESSATCRHTDNIATNNHAIKVFA